MAAQYCTGLKRMNSATNATCFNFSSNKLCNDKNVDFNQITPNWFHENNSSNCICMINSSKK